MTYVWKIGETPGGSYRRKIQRDDIVRSKFEEKEEKQAPKWKGTAYKSLKSSDAMKTDKNRNLENRAITSDLKRIELLKIERLVQISY